MSQSPMQRNIDGILPPGEVIEEIVELVEESSEPATPAISYHPTRWEFINHLLDITERVTKGRAGLVQRISTFLVIGGTCAVLNLIFQAIALKLLPAMDNQWVRNTIASLIGTELSLVINFGLNDYFTFRHLPGHQRSIILRFLRYHLTALGGVILTTVISSVLATYIHFNPTIAQGIAIIIVLFYNFTFHHIFTYRHVKTTTAQEIVS